MQCAGKKHLLQKIPNRYLQLILGLFTKSDPGFSHSEEADICRSLLQAYEQGDQELLENMVRRQQVSFLDNEIAKLSRTLTVPGETLSSGATGYGLPMSSSWSHSSNYSQQPTPPPSLQPARAPMPSDTRALSPAEARAELYGNRQYSEKPAIPPPSRDPRPYQTTPDPSNEKGYLPNDRELDEDFSKLNLQPSRPAPQPPKSQPLSVEEGDDYDGLR